MGENGDQASLRVQQETKDWLAKNELPVHNKKVNVKQLAKRSKVNRNNFYESEPVIKLVNKKAAKQGLEPLLLPEEREERAEENPGKGKETSKPKEVKELETEIKRLQSRVTDLGGTVKDLTEENERLQKEIARKKRHQFLDEMALEGRPVRDAQRQPL